MKPTSSSPWTRLVAAARTVEDDRATDAPSGFATRVVALAFAAERPAASLFELFSWRALGVAGILALACVLTNYRLLSTSASVNVSYDEVLTGDDAVAQLLDRS